MEGGDLRTAIEERPVEMKWSNRGHKARERSVLLLSSAAALHKSSLLQ